MKAKVAVVMCPAWSLETPPLSLGLLAGALLASDRKGGSKAGILTEGASKVSEGKSKK